MSTITRMIAGLAIFTAYLLSPTANAIPILDVATFLMNFDTADMKQPTSLIMNETESTFDLAITGSIVDHELDDDTGSFSAPIVLNFWRGDVTFGQVDSQTGLDSVTASISLFHQAGLNRPHPGDALKGDIFTFPSTTLTAGAADVPFGKPVPHRHINTGRAFHTDRYYDGLFHVTANGSNITGWNFNMKALHISEPPVLALMIIGGLALCFGSRRYSRDLQ